MLQIIRRKRRFLSLPFFVANLQATFLQLLPNPVLTRDQVKLLKQDNVVSQAAIAENRTLDGLGIEPHSMEAVLPTYMGMYMQHGQYAARKAVSSK